MPNDPKPQISAQSQFYLELDIAHDCTIGELTQFMETYNARIESFVAIGPAGGNPLIKFAFSDLAELHLFRATYQTGFCNPVSIITADQPKGN